MAAIVAVSLVTGAVLAGWYVNDVSKQNANSLMLRDMIGEILVDFRRLLWNTNQELNTLMITSDSKHHQAIIDYLDNAEQQIKQLQNNQAIKAANLSLLANDLQTDFNELEKYIEELIRLRGNPDWVYPMFPFIRKTLLESNVEFEAAVNLSLDEVEAETGGKFKSELYLKLDKLRDLWRLKILNFRAVIIRFAGLNTSEYITQENNVGLLHQQINKSIAELIKLREQGKLGFETEEAVNTMQYRSDKWYKDFLRLKKLRESGIWRADIVYFNEKIQPSMDHLLLDINGIEEGVSLWSANKIAAVENAAYQINMGLWGLSGLALLFVIIVYIMLDRSILLPIAKIAEAISTKAGKIEYLKLPRLGSKEVFTLISSFNSMRQQIHHRQIALEYQALHDSLTGLPNRALLHDRLIQSIHSASRDNQKMTLMILDLDRFKEINDTLGHQIGDILLQKIGDRLSGCIRSSDTVARLGGDEFAIVCSDGNEKSSKLLLEKIISAVEEEIKIDNQFLYVGVSIGVAVYPQHGEDVETLIRHADIAMYAAKNTNKNYVFFEEDLDRHSIENLSLLRELRTEISNPSGQISVHYQPQIDLLSRQVIGAEALLRWEHPKHGYILPEKFIRIAEQSGLISDLSNYVLEYAISDCAQWQKQGIAISVSVNLSAWDLQNPDLVNTVKSYLEKYQLNESKLCLEITESVVMEDPVRAREVLSQLNEMGVILYIDDYGTGFSSLAYLKLLPVDGLKIDKSFVIDMLEDENDFIIVRSTIDMAHNLGLKVIAEGVEQHEALLQLRQQRCDFAQGFHLARPMQQADFNQWYENYHPKMVQ
jgi:diguanylate cyclase (GGDEF)-like protein